ncbi:MAG: hypothetical protein WD645_06675 [Dehalococcoidia bacterium]
MDQGHAGNHGDVVGEYVGTVTGYQPTVQAATVRLRAPVRKGAVIRISSNGAEWEEQVRVVKGGASRDPMSFEREVLIKVRHPVDVGADVFKLWSPPGDADQMAA